MTDLMVSSKRPRAPSFANKHPDYSEGHATATSDWSPEKEMRQIPVKTFLEICRFCKKNLRHDEDVFMYGYFGAFCSKNCRAKQIACDIFTESSREIAKAKKGRTGELIRAKESKAVGNRESIASPRFYI